MLSNGPWAIENKLLAFDAWKPNVVLPRMRITVVAVWFRLYGLPLEYLSSSLIIQTLGPSWGKWLLSDQLKAKISM